MVQILRYGLMAAAALLPSTTSAWFMMYADQYHTADLGNPTLNSGIDHAIMAFLPVKDFLIQGGGEFKLFEPVETFRARFPAGVKVMAAIGGWGDTDYSTALQTANVQTFAKNCKLVIDKYGLDGLDLDFEYVGGNGPNYRKVPNSQKVWEIDAFPPFLQAVRNAIGKDKFLSIAVPGLERDMLAFNPTTTPKIAAQVDSFNIMTYDLMNRRDSYTKHHTDVVHSYNAVKKYLDMGLPKEKATMGFAFYAKYFSTDPTSGCATTPLGPNCKTVPLENPDGSDNGKSGALPFDLSSLPGPGNLPTSNDGTCGARVKKSCAPPNCCSSGGYCGTTNDYCGLACIPGYGICSGESAVQSWSRAIANPKVDNQAGGHYYYDQLAELFITWDEPVHIDAKFAQIVQGLGIKGVMAWSLSEDSLDRRHLKAIQQNVKKLGLSSVA
ncbi:putative glycosyl hydrolase, family 18 [Phyllosticta citriasiana]|uniref:putative glycosyl hydrolase, family 18 n=1 Tax=Phyllosticta citriasiana TaxID=595635 RepID=UPI0030FD8B11